MRATFKKVERLSGKTVLADLFKNGKSVKAFPFVLLYKAYESDKDFPARLAISIPKRKVKSAVKRNRIRRMVREAYRLQKQPFYDVLKSHHQQLAMLIIFVGNEATLESNLVHEKISRLLARLCIEVTENYQADKPHEKSEKL